MSQRRIEKCGKCQRYIPIGASAVFVEHLIAEWNGNSSRNGKPNPRKPPLCENSLQPSGRKDIRHSPVRRTMHPRSMEPYAPKVRSR